MNGKLLLTVEQAAEQLLCSRSRVFELLATGVLKRGPKFGKKTCVTAKSVEQAIREHGEDSPPPKRRPSRARAATEFRTKKEMLKALGF